MYPPPPAMSYRRELDLEVAEAIRLTSNAARETEKARRKFSEAAERLENGRKELLTSRSRWGKSGLATPVLDVVRPESPITYQTWC